MVISIRNPDGIAALSHYFPSCNVSSPEIAIERIATMTQSEEAKQPTCTPNGNDDCRDQKPYGASTRERSRSDYDERRQSNEVYPLHVVADELHKIPLCGAARPYSMSSSARVRSETGIVMPSALAVFILIAISNLVGACTGRSAGFSLLRMRST